MDGGCRTAPPPRECRQQMVLLPSVAFRGVVNDIFGEGRHVLFFPSPAALAFYSLARIYCRNET